MDYEIQSLLGFNPPKPIYSAPSMVSPCPLTFYDKHCADNLKRVVTMPSLAHDLSEMVDRRLSSFKDCGTAFPPKDSAEFVHKGLRDAGINLTFRKTVGCVRSLVDLYQFVTSRTCKPLSSLLAIHPSVSCSWFSLFHWSRDFMMETTAQPYVMEEYALRLAETCADETLLPDCISRDMKIHLGEAFKRCPELATWQIIDLSVDNEEVIKSMDQVASLPQFPFQTCLTTSHLSRPHVPVSRDALSTPWSIPCLVDDAVEDTDAPWKNTRFRHATVLKTRVRTQATKTSATVTPKRPRKSLKTTKSSLVIAQELLQHAWGQCVLRDTTLVVFHCGSIERIGVRHRQTQTLHLSDVIDISACKDPAYGKLHVGLYLAALEDTLDRVKQQLSTETQTTSPGSRKRSLDDEDVGLRHKRVKTEPRRSQRKKDKTQNKTKMNGDDGEGEESIEDISRILEVEVARRPLVLLYIRYSGYHSQSPASFLRLDPDTLLPPALKSSYSKDKYMTLVLTSEIGAGATGNVHGATLELQRKEGPPLVREVVVKLSFIPEQQERLRHEYSIYQRLSSCKTPGMLSVFGLFEDIEGGALALVMDHGGTSLWDRERKSSVTVSPSEREAFLATLESIHKANVVHCDIRPPNLLVGKDGKVFIIDFDKAKINHDEQVFSREQRKLGMLLSGRYVSSG